MNYFVASVFMSVIVFVNLYAFRRSIALNRRWTIARNIDWAQTHNETVSKLLQPSFIPFIAILIVGSAPVVWSLVIKPATLLEGYTIGIVASTLSFAIVFGVIEKLVARIVPLPEVRIARLAPRSILSYFKPALIIPACILTGGIFVVDVLYGITGILPLQHVVCNIIFHIFLFGICIVSMLTLCMDRPIHYRELEKVTDQDIYEITRRWAIHIVAGIYYFSIAVIIVELAGQRFGYEFAYPIVDIILERMHTPIVLQPLIPPDFHTIFAAIQGLLLIPVIYLLLTSKPIKIISELDFTGRRLQEEHR